MSRRSWSLLPAFLVGALTLPAPAGAQAGWVPAVPAGFAGEPSGTHDVAVNGDGDAVLLTRRLPGSGLAVQVRPAGGQWSAPQEVAASVETTTTGELVADAAIDEDGNARVVWVDGAGLRTTAWPAGAAAPANVASVLSAGAGLGLARIAVGAGGRTLIAWSETLLSSAVIRAAVAPALPAQGADAFVVQPDVYASATASLVALDVAAGPTGALGLTWATREGVSDPHQLHGVVAPPAGPFGSDAPASPPALSATSPVAVMRGSTLEVVHVLAGDQVAAVARADGDGAWADPVPLGAACIDPQVAADGDGTATTAAWLCAEPTGDVFTATRHGGGWGAPTSPSGPGGGAEHVAVAAAEGGAALVAWSAGDSIVRAARRAAGGAFGPAGVAAAALPGQRLAALDGDAAGNAVALLGLDDPLAMGDDHTAALLFDAAPPALLASGPGTATAGTAATGFVALASESFSALDGDPQWAFGDGATATGSAVSHTYAAPGTYTVTVTQADAGGNLASSAAQIVVAAASAPAPVVPSVPFTPVDPAPAPDVSGASVPQIPGRATLTLTGRRTSVRLTCAAAGVRCRGTLTLQTRGTTSRRLARSSFTIVGGRSKTVTLRLSHQALRLLREAGYRTSLVLSIRDRAGNTATVNRPATLKVKIVRRPRR